MKKIEENVQLCLVAGVRPGVRMRVLVVLQFWGAPSGGVRMRGSSREPDSLSSV